MNRTSFTAACLTVISSFTFAQLPPSDALSMNQSPERFSSPAPSTPAIAQPSEFTPTTNLPFFSGGPEALKAYFENPALYPKQARKANFEGTVHVQFRVLPSGHLTDIRVVKSSGKLLDAAAINAVASMPRWYPAHRAGVAVSSLYELPFSFKIQ